MVKGITTDKIQNNPAIKIKNSRSKNPQWCDILINEDKRLDFAKCQMLVWTIIAIFDYLSKCYYFIYQLLIQTPTCITELFNHFYEDYSSIQRERDISLPYVPYLPWTFVVLMGLSQGAYVGKKLVPSFKEDEAKSNLKIRYESDISRIDNEIQYKLNILNKMKPLTSSGEVEKVKLQQEILDLTIRKKELDNKYALSQNS